MMLKLSYFSCFQVRSKAEAERSASEPGTTALRASTPED